VIAAVSPSSLPLDDRRELAIEVREDNVVDRLYETAEHDWAHSHPMDLPDECLLADLEDRIEDAGQRLGLEDKDYSRN